MRPGAPAAQRWGQERLLHSGRNYYAQVGACGDNSHIDVPFCLIAFAQPGMSALALVPASWAAACVCWRVFLAGAMQATRVRVRGAPKKAWQALALLCP